MTSTNDAKLWCRSIHGVNVANQSVMLTNGVHQWCQSTVSMMPIDAHQWCQSMVLINGANQQCQSTASIHQRNRCYWPRPGSRPLALPGMRLAEPPAHLPPSSHPTAPEAQGPVRPSKSITGSVGQQNSRSPPGETSR